MGGSGWIGRNSALLAWVVLVVLIAAYVAAYDVWAYRTGHRQMTTQFRDWLAQQVAGPVVMGIWGGVFIALTMHFIVRAKH